MKSKLFLNYPTCIDHAIIDNTGKILGGSYHPIITVEGKVTSDENVVVDFSSCKGTLKKIIDNPDGSIGFDHKLWIIPGYSACMTKNYDDTHYEIETHIGTIIRLPKTDVHVCQANFNGSLSQTISTDMERVLTEQTHGEFEISVKLTESLFAMTTNPYLFRYAHGLKDSTSYGCKNIAHGHLSYLEITERHPEYRQDCQDCQMGENLIENGMRALNGVVFINRANVVDESNERITIQYATPRGDMYMSIDRNNQPNVILETETTAEFLAEFVCKRLLNAFMLAKVKEFRISEGLQKGVVYLVPSPDDSETILF